MAMPLYHDPGSLMTLDEWSALPEDNTYRYELQEGVLLVSPELPVAISSRPNVWPSSLTGSYPSAGKVSWIWR
jgi:hypothetical protein